MKKLKFTATLCILLVTSLTMMSPAQVAPRYLPAPIDWSWTTEDWGGNDKPYIAARESIGKLYKQKKLNDTTLAQHKRASFAKQTDPLLRFKWAYYAYCYALLQPDISLGSGKLNRVDQAFRFEKSPQSYQYTRLRFLVLSYLTHSGPELRQLGERLLKRNPKDVSVKYVEITHLNNGDAKEQKRALRYAKQLVQANPKEGAYYAKLGGTYLNRWYGTRSQSDAQAAIANYRRYIFISKLGGAELARVEEVIRSLQSGS